MSHFVPGLRELLRYGYAGILGLVGIAFACTGHLELAAIQLKAHQLIAGAVVLPLGALVYAFHRVTANDCVFEPLVHLHAKKRGHECVRKYLEGMGVPRTLSLNAYRVVRDVCIPSAVRRGFHTQNSEITLIHLTFTILILTSLVGVLRRILKLTVDIDAVLVLIVVAIAFLCLGVLATKRICRQQYVYLKALTSPRVHRLVRQIATAPVARIDAPHNNPLQPTAGGGCGVDSSGTFARRG